MCFFALRQFLKNDDQSIMTFAVEEQAIIATGREISICEIDKFKPTIKTIHFNK